MRMYSEFQVDSRASFIICKKIRNLKGIINQTTLYHEKIMFFIICNADGQFNKWTDKLSAIPSRTC